MIEIDGKKNKVGLALSGGGFRASIFHMGVLRRLHELEILPKIDVISTVSGGSILGAALYLRLRCLLKELPDDQITIEHYIECIKDLELVLFEGVSRNLRMRTYSNLFKNVKLSKPATGDFEPPASYDKYDNMMTMMQQVMMKRMGGGMNMPPGGQ